MPFSVHVSNICQDFNYKRLNGFVTQRFTPLSQPLKVSHVYDLLAISLGLDKFNFNKIEFIATSIMNDVETYNPQNDINIISALSSEISKKINLENQTYCDQLAAHLSYIAFSFEGLKLRHPDQLLVMCEELYSDAQLAWENIDDIIVLIDSLEIATNKKTKVTHGKTCLILHWCYATLKVHENYIEKKCRSIKVAAKCQALLGVYRPYIDIAVVNAERWFNRAIELKEPAALDLKELIKNIVYSKSTYIISHPFIKRDSDYFEFKGDRYFTPFGRSIHHAQFKAFENLIFTIYSNANSDLEFAIVAFLYRKFRRDMLGIGLVGEDDLPESEDTYKVLYSDHFFTRLEEVYPLLYSWEIDTVAYQAQILFNDMFKYYLRFGNFESYQILPLVPPTMTGA